MSAQYIITLGAATQLPKLIQDGFLAGYGQERIAFVGRSNVGKSTLINRLVGQRIAHVSKVPGKTQAVHFFLWPESNRIIADLPGYGFAQRSKDDRAHWAQLIGSYIQSDPRLLEVLLLLDSRHEPSKQDVEAWEFLKSQRLTVNLILTKTDQIRTQKDRAASRKRMDAWISKHSGGDPVKVFWVNEAGEGLKDLTRYLQEEREVS